MEQGGLAESTEEARIESSWISGGWDILKCSISYPPYTPESQFHLKKLSVQWKRVKISDRKEIYSRTALDPARLHSFLDGSEHSVPTIGHFSFENQLFKTIHLFLYYQKVTNITIE